MAGLFRELFDVFLESHEHPANRVAHAAGFAFLASAIPRLFTRPTSAFKLGLIGGGLIAIGHLLEGKPPAFVQKGRAKKKTSAKKKASKKPRRKKS